MKMTSRYSLGELSKRLVAIASHQKKNIFWGTFSSIIGNLARMTLMGYGAAMILRSAGMMEGNGTLYAVCFVMSALVISGMRYVEGVATHAAAYTLLADMRADFFHKLRTLAPACLVDREKGDIISIAIADIDIIEKFFAHTIGPRFTVILLPMATLCYAVSIDAAFALVLLPVYIIISVIVPLIALEAGRKLGRDYRAGIGQLKSLILESVYGLRDIQIFGNGEKRLGMIRDKSVEINRTAHGMTMHKQLVTAIPHFFIYLSRLLIVFTVTWRSLSSTHDLCGVIILSFIVSASFSSTQSLISVVTSLLETFAAAERLFTIYDELPKVTERQDPVKLTKVNDILFEDVTFSYRDDTENILEHADIVIRKGEKIGIIGPSGTGKSTVLRLLLRFWDPTEGIIKLDDVPLRDAGLKSLREHIALVEQHTFIYDDTVSANIALGKPGASIEEIRTAAERAGISGLIERLPEGYMTPLGEFGNRLSGGERQRVGIARIMLMDPDVIVMDEPTSSLDVFNEKIILNTLEKEYSDRTVIIVSHRRSTLTGCDRIFRLIDGILEETA